MHENERRTASGLDESNPSPAGGHVSCARRFGVGTLRPHHGVRWGTIGLGPGRAQAPEGRRDCARSAPGASGRPQRPRARGGQPGGRGCGEAGSEGQSRVRTEGTRRPRVVTFAVTAIALTTRNEFHCRNSRKSASRSIDHEKWEALECVAIEQSFGGFRTEDSGQCGRAKAEYSTCPGWQAHELCGVGVWVSPEQQQVCNRQESAESGCSANAIATDPLGRPSSALGQGAEHEPENESRD